METSKLLWRRQSTVIGSLRPPIGERRSPPPPPSQGRCLSPRRLLNLVSASRPRGARNPTPGSVCAPCAPVSPPRPGQRHSVRRGLLAAFLRGYQASPSARETLARLRQAGNARGLPDRLPGPPPWPGAGGEPQVGLRCEGNARGSPAPKSNPSTQLRAEGQPEAEPEGRPVPRWSRGGPGVEESRRPTDLP